MLKKYGAIRAAMDRLHNSRLSNYEQLETLDEIRRRAGAGRVCVCGTGCGWVLGGVSWVLGDFSSVCVEGSWVAAVAWGGAAAAALAHATTAPSATQAPGQAQLVAAAQRRTAC